MQNQSDTSYALDVRVVSISIITIAIAFVCYGVAARWQIAMGHDATTLTCSMTLRVLGVACVVSWLVMALGALPRHSLVRLPSSAALISMLSAAFGFIPAWLAFRAVPPTQYFERDPMTITTAAPTLTVVGFGLGFFAAFFLWATARRMPRPEASWSDVGEEPGAASFRGLAND